MHANNESDDGMGGKDDLHPYNTGVPAYDDADYLADPTCKDCHDREGDGLLIASFYDETGLDYVGRVDRPITAGCESCHGSGANHFGIGDVEFPTPGPDRCMICHELLDADGVSLIANTAHDADGADYMITDTHYAEPGSFTAPRRGNIANIAGYVIRTGEQTGCSDCHDPHGVSKEINIQWVASGHANIINTAAWAHYNWSEDGISSPGTPPGDRTACQHCHTSTGFAAFANATYSGTAYNAPVAYDANWKPEMLLCWACHTSVSTGELRNQAPLSNTIEYTAPAGRLAAVPDNNALNICLTCHSGRAGGEDIKNSTDDFGDKSFSNSHYLAAGGTVYMTIGYEYSGRNYHSSSHGRVGTSAAPGTGSSGPCAACHMKGSEGHTLHAVTRDGTGAITGIPTYWETCSICHLDEQALIEEMEALEAGFHASLEVLESELGNNDFTYLGRHPYFSNTIWNSPAYPEGKNNLGAAFNFAMLHHEPGAYVHNKAYTKQLLYDSIDWMDNFAIDNSVEAGITNAAALGFLYGTRP
jgi:hypothetical protein